jgi:hypothetical protein
MNIFDYLDWRADIPFSVDPFNYVDNLVLCELSYARLKDVLTNENMVLTIEELTKRFFQKHSEEEVRQGNGYTATAPLLLLKMAGSRRYGGTRVFAHEDILKPEKTEQMSAVSFLLPDHTLFAAYRGTDSSIAAWKEDFTLSYITGTPGQQRAVSYLNRHFIRGSLPIRVGGHSKGGNFAVYASAMADEEVRKRIVEVYSNDGPGFREEFIASRAYQETLPKIISIIPASSMIGQCMENEYVHLVVKSDNDGIEQHDALSWQVLRNHFVEAEEGRTSESYFFDRTIRHWIEGIDDENRKQFIDSLFSFYEATGKKTMNEVKQIDPWTSMKVILNNLNSMEKEDQRQFLQILLKLVKSANLVLTEDAQENIRTFIETRKENRQARRTGQPDQKSAE